MKRQEEHQKELDQKTVDSHLALFRSLSEQELADAEARASRRFRFAPAQATTASMEETASRRSAWGWRLGFIGVAAAIVFAIFLRMPARIDAPAMPEDVAGSRKIEFGEVVRSNDAAGRTLVLADGSRVEMRAKSELLLEHANDGVRIRLRNGGVIVNAAKQRNGHLYVQTKDVTVSVIGTVFLVNAEEEGSRVAVIEGEVRVQQGTTEKRIRPGEQVTTNPSMPSPTVKEGISWSHNAETHLSLLQQSVIPIVLMTTPQLPADPQLAFEVASIREGNSAPPAGGRGGGPNNGCGNPPLPQIDPSRFHITNITLFNLVGQAYPARASATGGCLGAILTNALSGGPGWVKSVQWDIEARIPEGSPSYTIGQFMRGEAPELHKMLQSLLADRFKLKLGRETKERPVYLLTVTKGGPRFNESRPQQEIDPRAVFLTNDGKIVGAAEFKESRKTAPPPTRGGFMMSRGEDQNGNGFTRLSVGNMSMSDWAAELFGMLERPVLDRTGLDGRFEFRLEYDKDGVTRPALIRAHEEQIGLRLEPATAPVEVWVIEHAEKPAEN